MNNSLLSLCLINSLWNKFQKTYIDNFVPLFTSTIIKHDYDKITYESIQLLLSDFFDDHGLNVPYHPACSIIEKCKKYGILRKVSNTYFLVKDVARKYDITKEIELNKNKQEKLIKDFLNYIKTEYDENIDQDLAANIILSFIKSNAASIFLSSHESDDQIIPEPIITQKTKKYKYIINKYVSTVFISNPELYRIVVEMSLGSIASNAILFSFSNQTTDSIRDCCIYLDAPIILKLIGADGKYSVESTKYLLSEIRNHGAGLFVFSHTYDEVREILDSSLNWVESVNFDPLKANRTTLYFRQEGYSKNDIELIITSIPRVLQEEKITISQKPAYDVNKVKVNEAKLQEIIEKQILERDPSFNKDLYKKRTLRDVDSISAIARLRDNNHEETLKEARYIFVTSNTALCYSNYLYRESIESCRNTIIESISDVFLGTYIWIGTPQQALESNNLKILASSLSAIRPDPELEQALYIEAKKMLDKEFINQDDFILLTTSFVVKDMISEKYYSEVAYVNEASIYEILDEVKSRIIGNKEIEIQEMNKKYKETNVQALENASEKMRFYNTLISIAEKKATTKTNISMVFVCCFVVMLIIIPILPSLFVNWVFISLSVVFTCISGYLSYFKGFSYKEIKSKLYNHNLASEKKRLEI